MEITEMIARINFLYHKSKAEGLTEEEKGEQTRLRKEYVEAIKGSVRNQLERIQLTDGEDKCCGHDHDCGCGKH